MLQYTFTLTNLSRLLNHTKFGVMKSMTSKTLEYATTCLMRRLLT